MTELLEFLKVAQGAGAPLMLIAIYFLWRIDRGLHGMIQAHEVLVDTLLRLVPGFRDANKESRAEQAEKRGRP